MCYTWFEQYESLTHHFTAIDVIMIRRGIFHAEDALQEFYFLLTNFYRQNLKSSH